MKFTCNRSELSAAVANVSRAVVAKSSIPALEGILLSAKDGKLSLTGYDLELGIETTIPASVSEDGELVLSARLFGDMVRRMPGDILSVEADEKLLTTLKSGQTEFTVLGMGSDEFPEMPSFTVEKSVSLPENVLKEMIGQTLFAVAVTDTRPVQTGSLFEIEDGVLTVVSVDGLRLALKRAKVTEGENGSFVVPGKTLSEIEKLLSDSDDPIRLSVARKHVVIQIGNYVVTSRLLEGEFLDYKAAIPQTAATTVIIDTKKFSDSVERAALIITDRLKSPVKASFRNGSVSIVCTTAIGKVNDNVAAEVTGNDIDIGFNNRYFLDALRACDCDTVKFEMNGPLSPIKVLPLEGDDFLFLVLPVRMKNE